MFQLAARVFQTGAFACAMGLCSVVAFAGPPIYPPVSGLCEDPYCSTTGCTTAGAFCPGSGGGSCDLCKCKLNGTVMECDANG